MKTYYRKTTKRWESSQEIDIDYIIDSIIVEYDPLVLTKEQIKNWLEKSGYKFVRTTIPR